MILFMSEHLYLQSHTAFMYAIFKNLNCVLMFLYVSLSPDFSFIIIYT